MSGGSMDYISFSLEEQEGCFKGDKYELELEALLKDFAELLHAREWYLSCDTGEGSWNEARDVFLAKHLFIEPVTPYCGDCKHWHPRQDSKYGICECNIQHLYHRCDPVCEQFKGEGKRKNTMQVKRPEYFSKVELIKHIKCIGQTIIERAEDIAFDPIYGRGLEITAKVFPANEVTTVQWSAEVYADPRVKGVRNE